MKAVYDIAAFVFLYIAALILVYFFAVFISWGEWSIADWDAPGRFFWIWVAFIVTMFTMAPLWEDEKKNDYSIHSKFSQQLRER